MILTMNFVDSHTSTGNPQQRISVTGRHGYQRPSGQDQKLRVLASEAKDVMVPLDFRCWRGNTTGHWLIMENHWVTMVNTGE